MAEEKKKETIFTGILKAIERKKKAMRKASGDDKDKEGKRVKADPYIKG